MTAAAPQRAEHYTHLHKLREGVLLADYGIPTGFKRLAQGCEERATLGRQPTIP